jgi:hypothetical protein
MYLLYALLTGVAAAYCLLAIWVAMGRRQWFVRVSVLLAALALLVPIRAYEPLVLLGLTSVILVSGWGAGRWMWGRKAVHETEPIAATDSRIRFGLSDLLLLCVVAAGISWLVSVVIARGLILSWWRFALAALMLSLISSLAVAVVRAKRRWIGLPALIVAVAAGVALDHFVLQNFLYTDELLQIWRNPVFAPLQGLNRIAALLALFTGWMLIGAAAIASWNVPYRNASYRITVRTGVVAFAMILVAFVICVYWHMLGVPQRTLAAGEPRENHLPQILHLSKQLSRASPEESPPIYAELLLVLKRPAAVSIDWSRLGRNPEHEFDDAMADFQLVRAAARQLDAECQRLRAAGRHDEAADFALAILRYGDSYRHGGRATDFLVGEANAGIGVRCLAQCRADLSRAKALEAVRFLESIPANAEPVEAVLQRDALWTDRAYTWRHRLSQAVDFEIWGRTPTTAVGQVLPDVVHRVACQSDLLMADLAVRTYAADRGELPETLADLVPQYLQAVPADAYSGSPLNYRKVGEEFVLYSTGQDGEDNGGKFANNSTYVSSNGNGYDYNLDTMIRP